MKVLVPVILGIVLVSVSTSSVLADPWYGIGSVSVGDQYLVTTVFGSARAWVNGRLVMSSASLEIRVQVTSIGPYNVLFRILSGIFQVGGTDYRIGASGWRGDYNLLTHVSVYQGPAATFRGGLGYFVLYGQDSGSSNGGVLMNISSDFRGEYGALWHVSLTAIRYQAS